MLEVINNRLVTIFGRPAVEEEKKKGKNNAKSLFGIEWNHIHLEKLGQPVIQNQIVIGASTCDMVESLRKNVVVVAIYFVIISKYDVFVSSATVLHTNNDVVVGYDSRILSQLLEEIFG